MIYPIVFMLRLILIYYFKKKAYFIAESFILCKYFLLSILGGIYLTYWSGDTRVVGGVLLSGDGVDLLTDQLSLGDADSRAAGEESCSLKTQTGNACSRRDCALAPANPRVCEDIQYLRLVSACSPAENSFFSSMKHQKSGN